jgi:hypothetical protein
MAYFNGQNFNPNANGLPITASSFPYAMQMPQQPAYGSNNPVSVIKVHGKEGALNTYLPPNSSTIYLDDGSLPIIWFKQTDVAGYPTVNGYKFSPLEEPAANNNDLMTVISSLSATLTDVVTRLTKMEKELGINAELDTGSARQSK